LSKLVTENMKGLYEYHVFNKLLQVVELVTLVEMCSHYFYYAPAMINNLH